MAQLRYEDLTLWGKCDWAGKLGTANQILQAIGIEPGPELREGDDGLMDEYEAELIRPGCTAYEERTPEQQAKLDATRERLKLGTRNGRKR